MTSERTGALIAAPTTSLPEDIGGVRNWVGGERRLTEFELEELPGYEGSKPVRIGNAASEQFQLDVYGELLGVAFIAAEAIGRIEHPFWPRRRKMVEYVETIWREPDDGIWETRGPRQRFTYSRVMTWVVFDRAVRLVEQFGLEAPLERWKQTRDEIHREVCERGYDRERRTFTQYYGSKELDASVLALNGRVEEARAISAAEEATRGG